MNNQGFSLDVGTAGFQHKDWAGTFYEEDMPEDWYFEFYSHEFHALLLEENEIPEPDVLREWLEDLDDSFSLLLPVSNVLDNGFSELLSNMSCFCGLIAPEKLPDDLSLPVYCSLQTLQECESAQDVLLRGGIYTADLDADLEGIASLPDVQRVVYQHTLSSGDELDLKAWKARYTELQAVLPASAEVHVIIAGTPPSLEAVRQLSTLAELMGC